MAYVTINRNHWLRGDPNPYLYDPERKKYDVLGKMLLDFGFDLRTISGQRFPSRAVPKAHDFSGLRWMVTKSSADTPHTIEIIKVNDSTELTDQEREVRLTALFNAQGVGITFSDVGEIDELSRTEIANNGFWVNGEFFTYNQMRRRYVSNTTGEAITASEMDRRYQNARHAQAVRQAGQATAG